jgi:hypothetical protein
MIPDYTIMVDGHSFTADDKSAVAFLCKHAKSRMTVYQWHDPNGQYEPVSQIDFTKWTDSPDYQAIYNKFTETTKLWADERERGGYSYEEAAQWAIREYHAEEFISPETLVKAHFDAYKREYQN